MESEEDVKAASDMPSSARLKLLSNDSNYVSAKTNAAASITIKDEEEEKEMVVEVDGN